MSEKYKVIDSTVPTFITITVVDWVNLFVRPIYCNILDESHLALVCNECQFTL